VQHHVHSMLCVDMVAGLGGHGVDNCLEHVHCHRRLGAIECRCAASGLASKLLATPALSMKPCVAACWTQPRRD
jgi:hypothetical protein